MSFYVDSFSKCVLTFEINGLYFNTGTHLTLQQMASLSISTTRKATSSLIELKYHFSCKEDAKKILYLYEFLFVKNDNEEENEDSLIPLFG